MVKISVFWVVSATLLFLNGSLAQSFRISLQLQLSRTCRINMQKVLNAIEPWELRRNEQTIFWQNTFFWEVLEGTWKNNNFRTTWLSKTSLHVRSFLWNSIKAVEMISTSSCYTQVTKEQSTTLKILTFELEISESEIVSTKKPIERNFFC